jgi:DNA-binding NarL/FixJ family response regulator
MRLSLNAAGSTVRRTAPNGGNKRVFLIDRHPLVREWLIHALSQESDVTICGHAVDAPAAMRAIAALSPDATILDLMLEDGSGFDVIERIISRSPRTAVLVLSSHDEPYYADRALRAGACGFVSKTEPTKKIVAALRCVLQGKRYLSPDAVQQFIGRRAREPVSRTAPSIENLSDRELEIFAMVGRGVGTRRAAALLHLSPKTIQAYHGRIKDKLRLCDASELMHEAIRWVERTGHRSRRKNLQPDYTEISAIGNVTTLPPHIRPTQAV